MKKTIIWGVVWLVCTIPQLLVAQTIYGKAGAAYRFGYPSMYLDRNFSSNWVPPSPGIRNYTEEHQGVYGTFGKGMAAEGAVGIKGKNLGVELGLSYLFTSSTQAISKATWDETNAIKSSTESFTHEHSMFAISPCFVLISDMGLYGRAGAVLGFPSYTQQERYAATASMATINSQTTEYSGAMALGYTVSMGYAVGVGGITLYMEADFVSLTWAPARSEIAERTRYGVNELPTMSLHARKTRYEESFTYKATTSLDPNTEQVSLKIKFPYSSVGLKAGILIGF